MLAGDLNQPVYNIFLDGEDANQTLDGKAIPAPLLIFTLVAEPDYSYLGSITNLKFI